MLRTLLFGDFSKACFSVLNHECQSGHAVWVNQYSTATLQSTGFGTRRIVRKILR